MILMKNEKSAAKTQVFAYDFFDTVVHRKCSPEEILFCWAKQCAAYCGYCISPSKLYEIRRREEYTGKKEKGMEELPYQTLLGRVYRSAGLSDRSRISFSAFLAYSFQTELSIEKDQIYPDEDCIREIQKHVSDGETVILISDFYVGKDYFEALLDHLGIADCFSRLYVSADLNRRKSTGNLYRYVLHDLGIAPGQLVMTGDNRVSDVEVPKKLGINAEYRENRHAVPGSSAEQLVKQSRRILFDHPMQNPVNGYAGEILYFISSLYQNLIRNQEQHVFFCSREGQFIKELFDAYQERYHSDAVISSDYFYVSRKAVLMPSLKEVDAEDFGIVFRQSRELAAADFLQALGFSDDSIQEILRDAGLQAESILRQDRECSEMKKLLQSSVFSRTYEDRRSGQKEQFLSYLTSLGVHLDGDRIALVDIGWRGTMQDCMRRALPEQVQIEGYYLGFAGGGKNSSDHKNGLVFTDAPEKSPGFDILTYKHTFFEKIFAADHGPVIGYADQNGKAVPVMDQGKNNVALYHLMRPQQEKLKDAVLQLADAFSRTCWEPCELTKLMVSNALYRQCLYVPRVWEFQKQARSITVENFGNVSHLHETDKKDRLALTLDNRLFGYSEYSYQILSRLHVKFLQPLAALYCRIVYGISRVRFHLTGKPWKE